MKRKVISLVITLGLSACLLAACSPGTSEEPQAGQDAYSEDSVLGYHSQLGLDTSAVVDVSIQSCASNTACHGGSWDSIAAETEEMWEGIGQITDANPHKAHATFAYACEDCHALEEGPSVNQCNGCHDFGTPEGWVNKDPKTTIYGPASDEPLY